VRLRHGVLDLYYPMSNTGENNIKELMGKHIIHDHMDIRSIMLVGKHIIQVSI